MTAAIDRLERCGFVERSSDSADRRARIVHLTDKGKKLIRRIFGEHECVMERVFAHLNEQERRSLAVLLRKLGHEADALSAAERQK
jgi:DNA-binding MarR family transcriptional regulator